MTKRGASRKTKQTQQARPSGLPWLVTGVVVGLFLAFLIKLVPNASDIRKTVTQNNKPASEQQSGSPSKAVFDFYTLLTESETVVQNVEENEVLPAKLTQSKKQTPAPSPPEKAAQTKYALQAGSFRSRLDADRRRAELILLGLTAQTQPVNIRNGETWYRVQVGPFANKQQMVSVKGNLAQHNIDSIALQIK
ncbi:SPOR domain-containing protein [Zooshikella harenae]|uniref:SPOR domain-containing protein n=1 Tax=Zooshikella harenae TaxID=2827238 RepID=A0ABS5Z6B5_9GAMM|nr:SPOR domain-containing protein [Zooshikella harenae]MBU2709584.1 SPOR domain-containing protein [Zooshikella harenae]